MQIVDLATRSLSGSFATQYGGRAYTRIKHFRSNGVELLQVGGGNFHALTGAPVATESTSFNGTTYPGMTLRLVPVGP